MTTLPINYLAVLVAAIAAFVVGFLWHGPLFGKQWLKLMGITPAQVEEAKKKGGMGKVMALAFLAQLVTAYVLSIFVLVSSVHDVIGATLLTFISWLGFIVTPHLNGVLWENRKPELYFFNMVYLFVSYWVMTVILTLWR